MRGNAYTVALCLILGVSSGCVSTSQSRDDVITTTVKQALTDDPTMNLVRVDVDTHQGTVYLSGEVDAFEHKMRAEQISRTIKGVNAVVNKLRVHD